MGLCESLEKELIVAMKAKDTDKLMVLRALKTAFTNTKIQKKTELLKDDEVLEIIQKQLKQRKESIESFEKAGRTELADKEKREAVILEQYLPKQLTDDEIRGIVKKAMAATGAASKADTGRLMKEVMPLVKGQADGRRVNVIVGELLA